MVHERESNRIVEREPEPKSPIIYAWDQRWNILIANAIDEHSPQLLSIKELPIREIRRLCPGFVRASTEDRKAFWALFLEAVASRESAFNPNARFQESWSDPETGTPQWSEGLLQLSYSDRQGHRDCMLDRNLANITEPAANLSCGVAILRRQLSVRKTLFPNGKPYYWSVLTDKKSRAKVHAYLQDHLARLAYCEKRS